MTAEKEGNSAATAGQSQTSTDGKSEDTQKKKKTYREKWPWGAQLFLTLMALIVLVGLIVFPPIYSATKMSIGSGPSDAVQVWTPMLSVLIALTTVTISGIFLFMTFRIDRGTRRIARRQAKKQSEKVAKKHLDDTAKCAKKTRDEITCAAETAKEQVRAHMESARESEESAKGYKQSAKEALEAINDTMIGARADRAAVADIEKEARSLLQDNMKKITDDTLKELANEVVSDIVDQSLVQAAVASTLGEMTDEKLQARVRTLVSALEKRTGRRRFWTSSKDETD